MKNSVFNKEENSRHGRYFSEGFKKKRVKELEKNLVSISDICKVYNVSRTSVYRWLYKYSIMAKRQERQIVESKSETKRIQQLEARIRELERVVGQKQMLLEFKEKMIEIAEEMYDIDIKKKLGSKVSSGTDTIGKNTITK